MPEAIDSDVCVLGAGPAGAAAAITLGRAGLRTMLVDRASFPRDKTCGDALTAAALRQLALLGFEPAAVPSWTPIAGAVVHPPDGPDVPLNLPSDGRSYAAIARRNELDAELRRLAMVAGAEPLTGELATLDEHSDGVTVSLADGSRVHATYAINATGARATTSPKVFHATRVYLTTELALPAVAHVWFEEDLLPGYSWMFPIGSNEANVGVAVHQSHHSGRTAVEATRRLVTSGRLSSIAGRVTASRIRSWPITCSLDIERTTPRTLWVGDAVGLADPMTGEGIGQALQSGSVAAEAIICAGNDGRDTAIAYRQALRRRFRADHRTSRLGIHALARPATARAAIRFMGGGPRLRAFFARWMWEDIPRSAVLSPLGLVRSLRTDGGAEFPKRAHRTAP